MNRISMPTESGKIVRMSINSSAFGPFTIDTSDPKFGKKAVVYEAIGPNNIKAVARIRMLESPGDRKLTQAQWKTMQRLASDFPDIVMPLLFTNFTVTPKSFVVEILPRAKITFEHWAIEPGRRLTELIDAISEIVAKLDRLNENGIFHRDSHGNNVMLLEQWKIIDWDDVLISNKIAGSKASLDSPIFLAFAVLILEERLESSSILRNFLLDQFRRHPFDYSEYRKFQKPESVASYYREKVIEAMAILNKNL